MSHKEFHSEWADYDSAVEVAEELNLEVHDGEPKWVPEVFTYVFQGKDVDVWQVVRHD